MATALFLAVAGYHQGISFTLLFGSGEHFLFCCFGSFRSVLFDTIY